MPILYKKPCSDGKAVPAFDLSHIDSDIPITNSE